MGKITKDHGKTEHTYSDLCDLSAEQRLELIANLVIDQILEDQAMGSKLQNKLEKSHAELPAS